MNNQDQSSEATVQELIVQMGRLQAELATLKAQVAGVANLSSVPASPLSYPQHQPNSRPTVNTSRRNTLKRLGFALIGGAAAITTFSFAPTAQARIVANPSGTGGQIGAIAVPPGSILPSGTPVTTNGTYQYGLVGAAGKTPPSLDTLGGGFPFQIGDVGVAGLASGSQSNGVYGLSSGNFGIGVLGIGSGDGGSGLGGSAYGDGGCGVRGSCETPNPPSLGQVNTGIYGASNGIPGNLAGYFLGPVTITASVTAATTDTFAVKGTATTGFGVYGTATNFGGTGVYGENTTTGMGVYGISVSGAGVVAESGTGAPLHIVPQHFAPVSPNRGDIYVNLSGDLFIYNGAIWKQIQYM